MFKKVSFLITLVGLAAVAFWSIAGINDDAQLTPYEEDA